MLIASVTAAAENPSPVLPEPADLIWATIAFVIVLVFVIWKLLPSMNKMLDARADAIEGGIKRADEAQAKATAALEEYNARLADARGEAAQIREQARSDGAKIIAEARENAQAEAGRVTANAQAQIAAERQTAFVQLRGEVVALAIDLAGGVIGESLADDTKAQAVVDRFLAEREASEATATPSAGNA